MTDHFYEEKEWDNVPAYDAWHDLEHVDVEITEVHSSDWLNVRDLELEHSEFSHSHIHSEPSSELVKQHFPHLAPPPAVEEPLPILLWFGAIVGMTALLILCNELLRYCVRARETTKNEKKKKSKEKEQKALTSSGPLSLIDALRNLCKVSHEMQSNNRAVLTHNSSEPPPLTNSMYTKSHCNELSRLAYSLYEHVHRNFHQFEAISSDPSWLQLELEQEAEQDSSHNHTSSRSNLNYSNGAIDVLAEVNKRIDAIIAALSPNTHLTSLSAERNKTASRNAHIEDRLNALYTQRDLSEVKVQFSLVRDALLKVQCVSDKGYIHDIVTRLRRAIENRNEYHLLECTVLLQELHLHHSTAFSEIHDIYSSAEAMLSEIHDQEDRNVRRAGPEKFLMDQNEMIDTFQAFSPREPNGSSKKQVFLTDSAKNHPINTPIVPETKETETNTNNESCGDGDEGEDDDEGVYEEDRVDEDEGVDADVAEEFERYQEHELMYGVQDRGYSSASQLAGCSGQSSSSQSSSSQSSSSAAAVSFALPPIAPRAAPVKPAPTPAAVTPYPQKRKYDGESTDTKSKNARPSNPRGSAAGAINSLVNQLGANQGSNQMLSVVQLMMQQQQAAALAAQQQQAAQTQQMMQMMMFNTRFSTPPAAAPPALAPSFPVFGNTPPHIFMQCMPEESEEGEGKDGKEGK